MEDLGKFKQLVHYVCAQSPNPLSLGATKLNKILWFAERESFLKLGRPVSGVKYIKLKHGPVPAPIDETLAELESDKCLLIRDVEWKGKPKREFISRREPSLNGFTAQEISIINQAIQSICVFHTADSISKVSHDEVWELARIGEEMPLYAAFGRRGETTPADISWAQHQLASL